MGIGGSTLRGLPSIAAPRATLTEVTKNIDDLHAKRYRFLRRTFEKGPGEFDRLVVAAMDSEARTRGRDMLSNDSVRWSMDPTVWPTNAKFWEKDTPKSEGSDENQTNQG